MYLKRFYIYTSTSCKQLSIIKKGKGYKNCLIDKNFKKMFAYKNNKRKYFLAFGTYVMVLGKENL